MNPLKKTIISSGRHQYAVAESANITETRLSRLATGRHQPTQEERHRLSRALQVAEEVLFPQGISGGCENQPGTAVQRDAGVGKPAGDPVASSRRHKNDQK